MRGALGEPLTATTTVTLTDLGTGTNTNTSSRAYAKSMGQQTDDAGHILGKQLGGSGGKKNIFAQAPNINRGQFAQFEGNVAKMIQQKGSVDIKITFDYANGGTRPTKVYYEAVASDGTKLSKSFNNPCS